MFSALQRHPFGVEAFFEHSLVLTYAVPKSVLAPLVGPGLEVDTYDDWGFLAIAMVVTKGLRPRGLPKWMGRNFFLSGYRIFTRFRPPGGKNPLRGLRILRSDTDRASMVRWGNLFTQYKYARAEVAFAADAKRLEVEVKSGSGEADVHVVADLAHVPAPLPRGSPFRSMDDARAFAGPLPYTFSFDDKARKMVVIKGLRTAWDPRPVAVEVTKATYLDRAPWTNTEVRLANAFYVKDVPYSWKPGTLEAIA